MAISRFYVAGMDCAVEEQLIRTRLATVPGVTGLEFDLLGRRLTVAHEPAGAGA